ncbi:MAG: TIGR02444 family protein [Alphaproteobacteria bacterium]
MDRNTSERNKTQPAPDTTGQEAASFWRFSLALYARPGVSGALIALQDRAGLDVNLILFGLWLGAQHGIGLDSDGFAAAAGAVAELNGVVRNIRALRRQLGGAADSDVRHLRRALLRLELTAERQVQRRLAFCFATGSLPHTPGDRRSAAHANLARCLGDESESLEAATLRRELAALTRRA